MTPLSTLVIAIFALGLAVILPYGKSEEAQIEDAWIQKGAGNTSMPVIIGATYCKNAGKFNVTFDGSNGLRYCGCLQESSKICEVQLDGKSHHVEWTFTTGKSATLTNGNCTFSVASVGSVPFTYKHDPVTVESNTKYTLGGNITPPTQYNNDLNNLLGTLVTVTIQFNCDIYAGNDLFLCVTASVQYEPPGNKPFKKCP